MSLSLSKPLWRIALAPILLALLAAPAASAATRTDFERGKIASGSSSGIVVVDGGFGITR